MRRILHIRSNPAVLGLLLVFAWFGTSAQKKKLPNSSARSIVKEAYPDSVSIHLDSAQFLFSRSPLRAIDHINRAIELCISQNDRSNEAKAFLILGDIQQHLEQYDLAAESYKKIIPLLSPGKFNKMAKPDNFQNQFTLYSAYRQIAICYTTLGKPDEAVYYIEQCLEGDFSLLPVSEQSESKRVLAAVRAKQNKTQEALGIYNEVLQEEKRQQNVIGEIKTLVSMGEMYRDQKSESKAIDYFTKAKTLAEASGNNQQAIRINDQLAKIFRKQSNVSKEVELRNSNIALNANSNNMQAVQKENIEIGNAYLNSSQTDKAESYFKNLKINPAAGNDLAQVKDQPEPQKLFGASEDLEEAANSYRQLSEEYLKRNDNEKAMEYLARYTNLQDSIRNMRRKELDEAINLSTSIGKNQQRMELLEKERQLNERSIDILKQDQTLKEEQLDFKNLIIIALALSMVLMLCAGYYVTKSSREKRKVDQLLTLKSLSGQMNPHFIFNALNSVNHYISQNDERAANRYLSDFSRLMRLVMDSSRHTFIPLSEEIDTLKLYLQLEHARFTDKFDYTYEVSEELRDLDFELPPMIIQPYIENAVWHGLRYMDEKGKLTIRFERSEEGLLVTIADNGIGRKKSMEIKTQNQKRQESLGMQNIESRIRIVNGIFKTNIRVDIADAYPGQANCGTRVRLFIPQKTQHHA